MDVSLSPSLPLSLSLSSDESTLRCSKLQLSLNLQPWGVPNHLQTPCGTDRGGGLVADPPASCRYRQPSYVHRPVWANLWHIPVDGLVSGSVASDSVSEHAQLRRLWDVGAGGVTIADVSLSLTPSSDESTLRCSKVQLAPNLQPWEVPNHLQAPCGTGRGGGLEADPPASCRNRQPTYVHRPVWANLWHMPVDGLVSGSVASDPTNEPAQLWRLWGVGAGGVAIADVSLSLTPSSDESTLRCSKVQLAPNLQPWEVPNHLQAPCGTGRGGGLEADPPASCRNRQPTYVHRPVWANLWHIPVDGLVSGSVASDPTNEPAQLWRLWGVGAGGVAIADVSLPLTPSSDESTLRCSKVQLAPNLQPWEVPNHLQAPCGGDRGGGLEADPPASCRYRQPTNVHCPVWANLWHMPVDGLVAVSAAVPPATCLYLQPVPWWHNPRAK